ncbi:RNA-dependent ATPase [Claviceps purpurea]|uniref:RNA helicase n=1 Tax=Claviceps purpurea (strain 20.1) TaxID=1111077 RepID=M1W902_CLAP2|nr:RNA-dependent ATPase [Claviceps purpurea]KAG6205165.1 RNA-dependent ATPase [Claviceps purpurea]KAG6322452.1 RNA-dependent ATPase [Claviceps purpurea]CCE29533.1 probable ATP dependent RNA helicase [Claviceps purpurea 20.1]
MAATKHRLAGDEPSRPSKKTKTHDEDVGSNEPQLKKEKKEKKDKKKEKKEKKDKKAEVVKPAQEPQEPQEDANASDDEAQRKAEKKAKKREKKEKKLRESAVEKQEDTADKEAGETAEETTKKEKKEKKSKPIVKSEAASTTLLSGAYTQTISLSNVAQADIDEFFSTNQVTITDPKGETSSLRPVIEFHHLPATNLLEKSPSPFANYKAPTPIQAASWPSTLSGRDAVGVAETGSGKTMAFALPCVESVSSITKKGTKAVVVSPTRELAMQTHAQLASLAALAKLKCVCLFGGSSKDEQRALINRGADIIVATPGRLKDFMSDGTVDLSGCRFAVLDEADRMLDKGFEDDIKEILGACPPREKRQTLMFTATWPQSVQALAATFMVSPVKVTIGSGGRETDGSIELQANIRISQTVEVIEGRDKEFRLLQLIKQHQQGKQKDDRILVFCLYKKEATRVEQFLGRKGIRVGGIHGDLKQEQRTRSLEAFKTGQTPVLVATDVAARGLDIPEVKLVINVTFPLTIEDYVHRIGRTGRAGKTGAAHTFFTVQDKPHSGSLINILKGANQPVPDELLKFGTTVKKKTHDMYGAFFKDVDMSQKATKITFD